jgi:hypothetical protein
MTSVFNSCKIEDKAIREGKKPTDLSEAERDYYWKEDIQLLNLVPRDVTSRAAKERCDAGFGKKTGVMYLVLLQQFDITEKNKYILKV